MTNEETNGMTQEQWRAHVRNIADSRCKQKHPDVYDSLICVGPNSSGFGPPCDSCVAETKESLEQKRSKAHGTLLSPEEAAAVRKRLGLPEQQPESD